MAMDSPLLLEEDGMDVDSSLHAALSYLDEFSDGITLPRDQLQSLFDSPLDFQTQDFVAFPSEEENGNNNLISSHAVAKKDVHESSLNLQQLQVQPAQMQRRVMRKNHGPRLKNPLKSNPNRARDEQRQELIYLRNKVKDLEEELERLKNAPAGYVRPCAALLEWKSKRGARMSTSRRQSRKLSVRRKLKPLSSSATASSVWEEMARGQYERRINAERENTRLKLILEGQLKIAKSLEKILNKDTVSRALESFGINQQSPCVYTPDTTQSDAAIFTELLASVEKNYSNIDAVFEANGLANNEYSHKGAQIQESGENGMYLEIFSNKILPFNKHTTATAVWQHFAHNMDGLPGSFYRRKDSTSQQTADNTVFESFSLEVHANQITAHSCAKQLLRRYEEEDRIVVVWRAKVNYTQFANEPVKGFRFFEDAYIVIKQPSTMSSDFTLVKSCFIITPDFSDKMRNEVAKTGALTDFVLSSIAMSISTSQQIIESVLFDQAMKTKSAS